MYRQWLADGRESVTSQGLSEAELMREHEELNVRMQEASAQMLRTWLRGLEKNR